MILKYFCTDGVFIEKVNIRFDFLMKKALFGQI